MAYQVRLATKDNVESLAILRASLWPDGSEQEHAREIECIIAGEPRSTLPLVVFVGEENDALLGFIEVGLRSHADGCDPTRPVGFIEGWYVSPEARKRGLGRALLETAERWCVAQGCAELASDTWLDNELSQRTHEALGFKVMDRCVNYRKELRRDLG